MEHRTISHDSKGSGYDPARHSYRLSSSKNPSEVSPMPYRHDLVHLRKRERGHIANLIDTSSRREIAVDMEVDLFLASKCYIGRATLITGVEITTASFLYGFSIAGIIPICAADPF